jgi:hypothetical protein
MHRYIKGFRVSGIMLDLATQSPKGNVNVNLGMILLTLLIGNITLEVV